jgi:phosphoribosylamine-glycine ligase
LGDPETEVIMPLIDEDLLPHLVNASRKTIHQNTTIKTKNKTAVAVINVAAGYPEQYEKGKKITIDSIEANEQIYYMGAANVDGTIISTGGRVVAAIAIDDTLENAIDNAYKLVEKIHFENKKYRTDIGLDIKKMM